MSEPYLCIGNLKYSANTIKTGLNNNVIAIGTSGSYKTRTVATPNLLTMNGNYVVSDPKGYLYKRYSAYLQEQGYDIRILDLTSPARSDTYNFFDYIRNTYDITKASYMITSRPYISTGADPFWEESSSLLLQALIGLIIETYTVKDRNLKSVLSLLASFNISDEYEIKNPVDALFDQHKLANPKSFAVSCYEQVRVAPNRTLRCIVSTLSARLSRFTSFEIQKMTASSSIRFEDLWRKKTIFFVNISDTDRSMDQLANIFFMQLLNELFQMADKGFEDQKLPIPVTLILDDFASACRIDEFPRLISSMRSRNISSIITLQSEAQLNKLYCEDAKTIKACCDTYVFMGTNDLATAEDIAKRTDKHVSDILSMPPGYCWIFRRGDPPVYTKTMDIDTYLKKKKVLHKTPEDR